MARGFGSSIHLSNLRLENSAEIRIPFEVNSKILELINQINPDLANISPGQTWQSDQGLHQRDQLVDLFFMYTSYGADRTAIFASR